MVKKRTWFAKGEMDIPETKGDRQLVWGDCFNGDKIDLDFWKPVNYLNVEDINHVFDETTAELKDGKLHLRSFGSPKKGEYTAPLFLTTQGKMEFRYGFFEFRAKLPFSKFNSPALWFCSSWKTGKGHWFELDSIELFGRDNAVTASLHDWIGSEHYSFDHTTKWSSHFFNKDPEVLSNEFHTYTIEWNPKYIEWAVDGEVYARTPLTEEGVVNFRKGVDMETFHLPIHVIISEYLYTPSRKKPWGGFTGNEDDFVYDMEVDYIALYQGKGEHMIVY